MARFTKFLRGLLYENGVPSRTGLAAMLLIITPLLAALILTAYLALSAKPFEYYSTFINSVEWMVTTGCGLLGANKLINNKYAAPDGQPFIKNQGDEKNG